MISPATSCQDAERTKGDGIPKSWRWWGATDGLGAAFGGVGAIVGAVAVLANPARSRPAGLQITSARSSRRRASLRAGKRPDETLALALSGKLLTPSGLRSTRCRPRSGVYRLLDVILESGSQDIRSVLGAPGCCEGGCGDVAAAFGRERANLSDEPIAVLLGHGELQLLVGRADCRHRGSPVLKNLCHRRKHAAESSTTSTPTPSMPGT